MPPLLFLLDLLFNWDANGDLDGQDVLGTCSLTALLRSLAPCLLPRQLSSALFVPSCFGGVHFNQTCPTWTPFLFRARSCPYARTHLLARIADMAAKRQTTLDVR